MTGPEHYLEAQECINGARQAVGGSDRERYYLAAAQVHATLALAAATAMAADLMPVWDANAWQDTAGTQPEPGTVEP